MRILVAAALALLLLAPASAGARATVTEERDCYEFVSRSSPSPTLEQLRELVPARYEIWEDESSPGHGILELHDYVCNDVAVDGKAAWPKPSIITFGTIYLSARDGQPGLSRYLLWHGTSNPHHWARFRALGVPSRWMPRSTQSYSVSPEGTANASIAFVGGRLEHTRTATAPEPPAEPIEESSSGPLYHVGRRGEVVLSWDNRFRPVTEGQTTRIVDPESDIAAFGFTPLQRTGATYLYRGGWTGHLALRGS